MRAIEREQLDTLFDLLRERGYELIGPVQRGGAIMLEPIAAVADLPAGWRAEQDGGHYRLKQEEDGALFAYANGPASWKPYLFPPHARLFRVEQREGRIEFIAEPVEEVRRAFIGVRPCDLAAILIQDRIFLGQPITEPLYRQRRENSFIVAVNCTEPAGTCFCVSMGVGPRAGAGFDLLLTELVTPDRHQLLIEAGSESGAAVLAELPAREATTGERKSADRAIDAAAARMGRALETTDLPARLAAAYDHPRWDEVARRCLTCGNCTMVCPTCFCTTVTDVTDLSGDSAERWRTWDSCFTQGFTYIHGGPVRGSASSRYRQWLTHKLGSWWAQFGTSGCVGCGRCITWCPVGIDITEEAHALCAEGG